MRDLTCYKWKVQPDLASRSCRISLPAIFLSDPLLPESRAAKIAVLMKDRKPRTTYGSRARPWRRAQQGASARIRARQNPKRAAWNKPLGWERTDHGDNDRAGDGDDGARTYEDDAEKKKKKTRY